MYILSQNGEVLAETSLGQIFVENREKEGDARLIQITHKESIVVLGTFSNPDRAKETMCVLVAALGHGDTMFKVPPDEFTEEVCRIYVSSGNYIDVSRTGSVVCVGVCDDLGHGCNCVVRGERCHSFGTCLSSLSERSVRNKDGHN